MDTPPAAIPRAPASIEDQVLEHLTVFETHYLTDPVHGYTNPFRRPGLTVSDLAYACGLVKAETTAAGRVKADLPSMRRVLKGMLAAGTVESTGRHRTLQCGSSTKECYARNGFSERLAELQHRV